jgi:hypothetical protein
MGEGSESRSKNRFLTLLPVILDLEATSFIRSFKWKVFGMKQR